MELVDIQTQGILLISATFWYSGFPELQHLHHFGLTYRGRIPEKRIEALARLKFQGHGHTPIMTVRKAMILQVLWG